MTHVALIQQFVSAINEDSDVPISADDARRAVETCTAIYQSALTGQSVELPLEPSSRFYQGITKDDYCPVAAR